jgi:hypothetical protein
MKPLAVVVRPLALVLLASGVFSSLAGCGSKEPTPATPAPSDTAQAPAAPPAATAATSAPGTWTPEALEELMAPVALYPDPVLSQLLIASTNPQEVLDAGNWLLQNQSLEGKALDDAAAAVGFTPPIRALVQFPETVDMMCLELGWTTEVGEAFVADQAGVLDAVQRLRKQAVDVGNLQTTAQMKVETEEQEGKEVVVLKPAQPEVVYVPQYDPVAAYAPPAAAPAAAPAATAPATTTTTTTTEDKGHSTGSMVATGVLAFGAGILVNEIFDDDDDDHHGYYYPNYGYGGMPYYPPYPYRPAYGGGYYPSHGYNRPPNYNSGFQNTGNIVINTGGNTAGGGYWDRYDNKPGAGGYKKPRTTNSPITAARPNRPEMNELQARKPRPMPADVKRPSPDATAANWKGQSGYAGSKGGKQASAEQRIANARPGYSTPAPARPGTREAQKVPPKVQGSYAGARPDRAQPAKVDRPTPTPATRDVPRPQPSSRDAQRPSPGTQDVQRPPKPVGDRGHVQPKPQTRPAVQPSQQPRPASRPAPTGGGGQRPTAVSGAQHGGKDRAASQRGRQSMPQGAHSKGGGKKQKR